MIKVSSSKYVRIKRYDIYNSLGIPTGTIDGDTAEFILFMSKRAGERVFLRREDIFS